MYVVHRNMGQALGKRIARYRQERGFSQEELARRAKISRSYVATLEGGHRDSPAIPVLRRLARALDVPVAALLG